MPTVLLDSLLVSASMVLYPKLTSASNCGVTPR